MNLNSEDDYNEYFYNNLTNPNDSMQEILHKLCFANNNNIIIDYRVFKNVANNLTYDIIFKHVDNIVKNVLTNYSCIKVDMSMKSLTISDVDKHRSFYSNMIQYFSDTYPNMLETCNIYLAPSIFVQVFSIFSAFIDKKSKQKIKIVDKNKKSQISLGL